MTALVTSELLSVRPESRTIATGVHPLRLRNGRRLAPVELEVETWGRPNAARDNAVLICHSFSTDAHAAGIDATASAHWRPWRINRPGWWDELIGPGKAIDTDRWWVVCSNVIGGIGSTNPASIDPSRGLPWGNTFPQVHVVDLVAAQQRLMDQLDIPRWRLVVGGSFGGLQALTWGVVGGARVERVMAIAAAARLSHGGREFFRSGLAHIAHEQSAGGTGEVALCQQFASASVVSGGTTPSTSAAALSDAWPTERFAPHTFQTLAQTLLDFDAAADLGAGSLDAAMRRIHAETWLLGYRDDQVFSFTAQARLAATIRRVGGRCHHAVLPGAHGHDSFLAEPLTLDPYLREALAD